MHPIYTRSIKKHKTKNTNRHLPFKRVSRKRGTLSIGTIHKLRNKESNRYLEKTASQPMLFGTKTLYKSIENFLISIELLDHSNRYLMKLSFVTSNLLKILWFCFFHMPQNKLKRAILQTYGVFSYSSP